MNEQALAVSQNWLNDDAGITTSSACTCTGYIGNNTIIPSYVYWTTPAARPIKLTMSDIERLRKVAKADDKIKAILAKFTDQIEIVVDFD